jgi:transposase InsO family protein
MGYGCSENRVARIMRKEGIRAKFKSPFRPKTTSPDPSAKFSPNALKDAQPPSRPGEQIASDITYVSTAEGWLYLSVVIDLFSRKILGWAPGDSTPPWWPIPSARPRGTSPVPRSSTPTGDASTPPN